MDFHFTSPWPCSHWLWAACCLWLRSVQGFFCSVIDWAVMGYEEQQLVWPLRHLCTHWWTLQKVVTTNAVFINWTWTAVSHDTEKSLNCELTLLGLSVHFWNMGHKDRRIHWWRVVVGRFASVLHSANITLKAWKECSQRNASAAVKLIGSGAFLWYPGDTEHRPFLTGLKIHTGWENCSDRDIEWEQWQHLGLSCVAYLRVE